MAFKFMDAGSVLQTASTMRVKDGSTLRRILRMKVMDTDDVTLLTVATFVQPLTVSASPTDPGGEGFGDGIHPTTVTSNSCTATPAGGLGPYTYSWAKVSGDTITANSPSSATTTFSGIVPAGGAIQAIYRVTVNDSSGQPAATADVTVSLIYTTV